VAASTGAVWKGPSDFRAGRLLQMPVGRQKRAEDHELAQALDLALRENGLTAKTIAPLVHWKERTCRRYVSAETRPDRDTVASWEAACGVEPGRLTAVWDRTHPTRPENASHGGAAQPLDEPAALAVPTGGDLGRARRFDGRLALGIGLLVVLVLIAGALITTGSGPHASSTPSAKSPAAGTVKPGVDTDWDRKDPQASGCSRTPEDLASTPVVSSGRRIGTLQLKGSTSCQAGWARVDLTVKHRPPIQVTVARPLDRQRDVYIYRKSAAVVFSAMLSHVSGCVYATVSFAQSSPPVAKTACRK
jgi:hypothetical protein